MFNSTIHPYAPLSYKKDNTQNINQTKQAVVTRLKSKKNQNTVFSCIIRIKELYLKKNSINPLTHTEHLFYFYAHLIYHHAILPFKSAHHQLIPCSILPILHLMPKVNQLQQTLIRFPTSQVITDTEELYLIENHQKQKKKIDIALLQSHRYILSFHQKDIICNIFKYALKQDNNITDIILLHGLLPPYLKTISQNYLRQFLQNTASDTLFDMIFFLSAIRYDLYKDKNIDWVALFNTYIDNAMTRSPHHNNVLFVMLLITLGYQYPAILYHFFHQYCHTNTPSPAIEKFNQNVIEYKKSSHFSDEILNHFLIKQWIEYTKYVLTENNIHKNKERLQVLIRKIIHFSKKNAYIHKHLLKQIFSKPEYQYFSTMFYQYCTNKEHIYGSSTFDFDIFLVNNHLYYIKNKKHIFLLNTTSLTQEHIIKKLLESKRSGEYKYFMPTHIRSILNQIILLHPSIKSLYSLIKTLIPQQKNIFNDLLYHYFIHYPYQKNEKIYIFLLLSLLKKYDLLKTLSEKKVNTLNQLFIGKDITLFIKNLTQYPSMKEILPHLPPKKVGQILCHLKTENEQLYHQIQRYISI